MSAPQFVLVKSASPRESFRRAGLAFTREWRPLQLAATADLSKGVIDQATLEVLEAEPMLAVKPASADEIEDLRRDAIAATSDKDAELSQLRAHNAELESRLMRLELGYNPALDAQITKQRESDAQIAELRAMIMQLQAAPKVETAVTKLETPPPAPTKADKK